MDLVKVREAKEKKQNDLNHFKDKLENCLLKGLSIGNEWDTRSGLT